MNHHHIAPLKNVSLFNELMYRTMNSPSHLPRMATFHGFSGYGKTVSAVFAANQYRALYVEAGHSWTQRKFCSSVLNELGVTVKGTIADQVDAIVEEMARNERPLIIDEFDFIVNKKFVELVREIHDKSNAPIILIGEELLPSKLAEWERFHNRVADWVPAQPADLNDVHHLAKLYCKNLILSEDLVGCIHKVSHGRVRRICVNLEHINEQAKLKDLREINLSDIEIKDLSTGQPPARRAA